MRTWRSGPARASRRLPRVGEQGADSRDNGAPWWAPCAAGQAAETGRAGGGSAASPFLPPASFVHLPAGMAHYAWVETETVVQINGVGPFDVTYVDPKDDPRNK